MDGRHSRWKASCIIKFQKANFVSVRPEFLWIFWFQWTQIEFCRTIWRSVETVHCRFSSCLSQSLSPHYSHNTISIQALPHWSTFCRAQFFMGLKSVPSHKGRKRKQRKKSMFDEANNVKSMKRHEFSCYDNFQLMKIAFCTASNWNGIVDEIAQIYSCRHETSN